MCRVSVLIPTYGHRQFVTTALESVWNQSFSDFEIIVVDDGSPDDTETLLRPIAEAGRIRYVRQENAGQASARNRAISMARGEFVALLDDDDHWPPDKLAWQVAALEARPDAALVYGYYQSFGQVDGAGRFAVNPSGDLSRRACRAAFIGSPGQTLIRASALRASGGFDPDLWGIDDWDLYIRLAAHGVFLYEDRNALFYRIHSANASKNVEAMFRNALRLRDKHLGRRPRMADLSDWWAATWWIRRHYARELQRNASILRAEGDDAGARRELRRIPHIDPVFFLLPSTLRPLIGRAIKAAFSAKGAR